MKRRSYQQAKQNIYYIDIRRSFVQCLTSSHRQATTTKATNKTKTKKCSSARERERE